MIGISEKSGSRGYEVSPQWTALNKESKEMECSYLAPHESERKMLEIAQCPSFTVFVLWIF